ncbi:MAG: hypothetical protein JWQ71_4088 [Pedosphaera sp.]|nr:hypothetical protein [Pedosphaera sp.]
MKYIICLLGVAALVATTGCQVESDYGRGGYGGYERGYGYGYGPDYYHRGYYDHRGYPAYRGYGERWHGGDWDHR